MRRSITSAASRTSPRRSRSVRLSSAAMADCQLCASAHPAGASCPPARTGQRLGDLGIGPVLGSGGIAAVYTAEHPRLRRVSAVKILHKRVANERELATQFVYV